MVLRHGGAEAGALEGRLTLALAAMRIFRPNGAHISHGIGALAFGKDLDRPVLQGSKAVWLPLGVKELTTHDRHGGNIASIFQEGQPIHPGQSQCPGGDHVGSSWTILCARLAKGGPAAMPTTSISVLPRQGLAEDFSLPRGVVYDKDF